MRKTILSYWKNYTYHVIHYRIRKSNSKIYMSPQKATIAKAFFDSEGKKAVNILLHFKVFHKVIKRVHCPKIVHIGQQDRIESPQGKPHISHQVVSEKYQEYKIVQGQCLYEMVLRKLDIYMWKNNEPLFHAMNKTQVNMGSRPEKVRHKL